MKTEDMAAEQQEIARRFPDLHPPFAKQAAVLESDRCLNCFDAPCTSACPTHIDVPRFIQKIASGNLRGAALGILDANVLGGSCARVCPVEVLCEGACVMHGLKQQPIAIGRLQRHAMDAFHASGESLPQRGSAEKKGRVACLGAGPASLAAAAELRQRGYAVTVFERRALPGGLNTYGVAEYKLRTADSLREIELIAALGVEFRFGQEICDEAELAALEQEYDLIFLGVGLGAMHRLAVRGGDHPSVIDALQFIEEYKLGRTTSVSGCVLVIGAGNTAIDVANAARRLGASEVRILYRRTEEHISAFALEYQHAKQEGVVFQWLTQPVAVHSSNGRMEALECVSMRMDAEGNVTPMDGVTVRMACDLVISAIGQSPLLEMLSRVRDLKLDRGMVVADRTTGATSNPKYFAGGDCANGGREVVDAVAEGKRAAIAMAHRLEAIYAE